MISKNLDDLTKDDIDALVTAKVPELKTLEYKAELCGNGEGEKKELLADIASFANAAGGFLIYGVTAERDEDDKPTGAPEEARGLSISSSDAEILRLENIARDGIQPRIPGLAMRAIDGFPEGPVIVIHVPRSFAAPHMVAYSGTSRFYARNSAGKYQLDVGEIRATFAALEAVPQAMRRFREERLARIISGTTPAILPGGATLVLHLYPLAATQAGLTVDLKAAADSPHLSPMNSSGWNPRYNFDGYVALGGGAEVRTYVQIFRNGCIEAVTTRVFDEEAKHILSPAFEYALIKALERYLKAMTVAGVDPPIAVMVSLLGVDAFRMGLNRMSFGPDIFPIDQSTIAFPDLLAEEYDIESATFLRPVFDMAWQASGVARCPYYDAEGQWVDP